MRPVKKMSPSVSILIGPDVQRNPNRGLNRAVDAREIWARDSDHGVRLRFRPHALAEHARVAVEKVPPRRVAEHCHRFILVSKPPADKWRDPHSLEVIGRNSLGTGEVTLVVRVDTGFRWKTGSEGCESLAAVTIRHVIGIRKLRIASAA